MKKQYIVTLILCAIVVVAGVLFINIESKDTIKKYIKNSTGKITVSIQDGSTGQEQTIEDESQAADIVSELNDMSLERVYREQSTGWSYKVTLTDQEQNELRIIFLGSTECNINGKSYEVNTSLVSEIESLCGN